jgi:hypothetical protein
MINTPAADLSHQPPTSNIRQPRTIAPTDNNIDSGTTAKHLNNGELLHPAQLHGHEEDQG